MIFDGENSFFYKETLKAAKMVSDVVFVGPGESGESMHLVLRVSKDAGDGTAETVLETSKTEDFSAPVTLGTYKACPLSTQIPRGNLGYLRLSVNSTYKAGTVTAGLVLDDDIH